MLSDSESSDDGHIVQLTINEHYAQAYKTKKEREELQKRSCPQSIFLSWTE
jgi:hypothetical protein